MSEYAWLTLKDDQADQEVTFKGPDNVGPEGNLDGISFTTTRYGQCRIGVAVFKTIALIFLRARGYVIMEPGALNVTVNVDVSKPTRKKR